MIHFNYSAGIDCEFAATLHIEKSGGTTWTWY